MVHPTSDRNSADSIPLDSPRKEAAQGLRQAEVWLFEYLVSYNLTNLEALAIEANKSQDLDDGENSVHANAQFSSVLMNCVGCEKCRLWGKHQVLGLGTALNILFSVNGQEHLGQTGTSQAGSLVPFDRLRFDFNFHRPLLDTELEEIEGLINGWIGDATLLQMKVMPLNDAKNAAAIAMFGEKYGEQFVQTEMGLNVHPRFVI